MLSGRGRRASLIVLMYHRVLATPDPLLPDEPTAAEFAAQMDLIAENFHVLRLSDAAHRLRSGTLPPRAVSITFDDGYSNNLRVAQPILAQRALPATVFVAPGFLGDGRMFNDTIVECIRRAPAELDLSKAGLSTFLLADMTSRRNAITNIIGALKYLECKERHARAQLIAEIVGAELPTDLMMNASEVRAAYHGGLEIGAHTVNHPILARLEPDAAEDEILKSRHQLQEITGGSVTSFAYPNGRPNSDYGAQHVAVVKKAGFELAVSTAWGAATIQSDPFQLPRIAPWDRDAIRFAGRMLRGFRERRFASVA
jgi:peptidoglycan/xylan/chitin deacetylase (PgdA/CDA1 family)